jgi:hypothetical protein
MYVLSGVVDLQQLEQALHQEWQYLHQNGIRRHTGSIWRREGLRISSGYVAVTKIIKI